MSVLLSWIFLVSSLELLAMFMSVAVLGILWWFLIYVLRDAFGVRLSHVRDGRGDR